MLVSNKSSGHKERIENDLSSFNPRSTYTGNLSVENHRSTFTSYQKKSEEFQEDLWT